MALALHPARLHETPELQVEVWELQAPQTALLLPRVRIPQLAHVSVLRQIPLSTLSGTLDVGVVNIAVGTTEMTTNTVRKRDRNCESSPASRATIPNFPRTPTRKEF